MEILDTEENMVEQNMVGQNTLSQSNQSKLTQHKPTQIKSSLLSLKNPVFIANSIDPLNGKFVKEIRAQKIMKDTQFKQNRIKFDIVWQYMRDRGRQSVESIYKKHKGKLLHVIYSGDPVIYDFIYE
jgi:hypothetical protein